jgi:hypothetical protein
MGSVDDSFESDELLREALDEVAEADVGDRIEEPWGSSALAAAEQVGRQRPSAELLELARAAVERVAANSQLRDLVEDEERWTTGIDELRRRLA